MQRQIVSFRTVLILLWGASPQAIILLILASSLTGFLTPIGLLCTQHFLDAIVSSVSAGGKFASVVIWLLLLLGVTLFGNLTSMALQTLRANFSDVLALHITQKISSKENIPSRIICVRNIEFYVIYIIRFHVPIFIQSGIFMIIQVVLFKQLLISQQFCIIDLHTITVRVLIRRNKIVVANWNKITRLINFVRDLIRKM